MATDPSLYKLNHSMIRVKDPEESIKFYELLGFTRINKLENPDAGFDLYFLAYDGKTSENAGKHWTDREGIIELTHNYGTEKDPNFKGYHNGNQEPQGFGHTCISVDNIQAACKRIEDAGYRFKKKLNEGRMNYIAFALDPDDYWVEIIGQNPVKETENVKETDTQSYRMNHTMIRVKDPEVSIRFYEDIMGMKLKRSSKNEDAGFTLYFLGYGPSKGGNSNEVNPEVASEGILELTHNHGTENDPNFKGYHNGNQEPQGFGHICVSVDDIDAACERFEQKGVKWKKRLTDGRMKNIAFILDPDEYWIEVIQNENLKHKANV